MVLVNVVVMTSCKSLFGSGVDDSDRVRRGGDCWDKDIYRALCWELASASQTCAVPI